MNRYASFWERLLANLIDACILLFLSIAATFLAIASERGWFVVHAFAIAADLSYPIVMHAKYGQTVGKRILRIQLRRVSGESITWMHALLRSSVDVAIAAAHLWIILFAAIDGSIRVSPETTIKELGLSFGAVKGARLIRQIGSAWTWSEIASVLLRKDRRALHDLLAGTIVVKVPR